MCLISNAKIELEAAIVAAFDGVKLEDGIGLYEAQAIDGYADLETRASNRSRDEKEDWKSITNSSLNECNSSVHFFDPKGMRFHLPAFMLCELQGKYLSDLRSFCKTHDCFGTLYGATG